MIVSRKFIGLFKNRLALGGLLAGMAAVAASSGCAAQNQGLAQEVSRLRSRIGELETAHRRDNERMEELTTRMVALETVSEPTATRRRPGLPVVRVRPLKRASASRSSKRGDRVVVSSSLESEQERAQAPSETAAADDDSPRPLLKIHESRIGGTVSISDSSTPSAATRRRTRVDLAAVNERLPVVPIAELPGIPALAASSADISGPGQAPAAAQVEQVISRARQQVSGGECSAAMSDLGRIITESPEHPLVPDAMLLRARCHRRGGAPLRAIGELERINRRYPRSNRRSQALLEMAEVYASLGDLERARQLYGQVMRSFPRSRAARRATVRVQELGRGGRAREER